MIGFTEKRLGVGATEKFSGIDDVDTAMGLEIEKVFVDGHKHVGLGRKSGAEDGGIGWVAADLGSDPGGHH